MIVHEPTRSLLIETDEPALVRQVVRRSKDIDYRGHNIAVKHGTEEVRVLRNMGINAPSPINHYYNYPGRFTPFDHQRETSAFLTLHRRAFILNEMGTGKTASLLWGLDFLRREELVQRTLVVAPLTTLDRVWRNEIFHTIMGATAQVLHGSAATRKKRLEQPVDFYIINHDGLGIVVDEIIKRPDINCLVVDEASVYRNGTTTRYKILRKLVRARPDMHVYLVSGAPCPNAPTDAWALARIVNPSVVPEYFGHFRAKVMYPLGPYKWLPKPGAYDEAYRVLQPGIRFKKEDCLDLPPMLVETRDVQLTKEQTDKFREMRNHMVADFADAKVAGAKINAVNAADQVNKLRQILCGVVRVPGTDDYAEIDHQPRVSAVLELIEQASAKVIVIVPFKGIIRSLAEKIGEHHTVEVLNGDVPVKQRNEIVDRFQNAEDPRVLLCHPKVMSHGLTLTAADTMVFYAPIYSNDEFQQVIERFNRPGQTRKMTVVRLGGNWLEWQIYKVLDERKIAQDTILALYEAAVAPGAFTADEILGKE